MLTVTKRFFFEAAHAIHQYNGVCRHVHGHRYELHVTVSGQLKEGMIIDLKLLKNLVNEVVIDEFDHSLILSETFITAAGYPVKAERVVLMQEEPTVEWLLLEIKNRLQHRLPEFCNLYKLKLYETRDSYAEWVSD